MANAAQTAQADEVEPTPAVSASIAQTPAAPSSDELEAAELKRQIAELKAKLAAENTQRAEDAGVAAPALPVLSAKVVKIYRTYMDITGAQPGDRSLPSGVYSDRRIEAHADGTVARLFMANCPEALAIKQIGELPAAGFYEELVAQFAGIR